MTEVLARSIDIPFDQNAPENYPYVVTLPNAVLVGVEHAYDPKDPLHPGQFELEIALWEYFMSSRNAKDCVAIVEGGLRKLMKGDTPESAYRRDAEPCMLTLLAKQARVRAVSGEPDIVDGAKLLLGKTVPEDVTSLPYYEIFDPDVLAYWHYMKFARQVIDSMSEGKSLVITDYDSYVRNRPSMRLLLRSASRLGLDFSLDRLKSTHTRYYPDLSFDPLQRKQDGSLRDAEEYRKRFFIADGNANFEDYGTYNELQRLGTFYSRAYRELELARLVKVYREAGKSIFSFEGGGHWLRVGRQLPNVLQIPREEVRLYIGSTACRSLLASPGR